MKNNHQLNLILRNLKDVALRNYPAVLLMLLFSLLAHSVVIYRYITDGTLFTGKGDGLAQMIPFQLYLYEQFTHLNFFYSMDFGIGGDFFRSLAYYYSTAPISYINFAAVYVLDLFLPLDTGSPEFWAVNQIYISIFKLAAILFITYKMLRYFGINKFASAASSFLYGYSTVYFFFTFTWSFFSDVMLFLPLTIYGMERFFKEKKILMFIIAIALTLHSNFYFSYYEFIFVLFYFVYRVAYPKATDITGRGTKILVISIASIIALMIAAVGFFTGVTSYLMNDRTLPPIKLKPFIDFIIHFNLFYDGYYVIIPFVTVMALMTFKLYNNYMFRLFAVITLLFMVGSLSPYFDSFFNGFSIDQRRWVYMLVFSSAVLIAIYLQHLKSLTFKDLTISIIPVAIIYPLTAFTIDKWLLWLIFIPIVVLIIALYIYKKTSLLYRLLAGTLIVMNLVFVYDYMTQQIDTLHPLNERNIDFMRSDKYNSPVQQKLIKDIQKKDPEGRIDWQSYITHNTPMYQHFSGIKLYSSIFDQDILQFYDKDLNVTMDTDSNSVYYRLGERANLYSLFNVNHTIRTGNIATLPYGFSLDQEAAGYEKSYQVYQNDHPLDPVRVATKIYSTDELRTPIDREHAMLDGVVLSNNQNAKINPTANLLDKVAFSYKDASYKSGTLTVDKDEGGIHMKLPKQYVQDAKDFYVELSAELISPSRYHYVWVNEIYQSRKPLDDNYRRFNPKITLRIKATEEIDIRLLSGKYKFSVDGIYPEDYKSLSSAVKRNVGHTLTQKRNKIIAELKPHDAGYAVIPAPYLKGMSAKVDGKKAEIMEGNYLMTAVKVNRDAKEVVVSYTPPYFHLMQLISMIGMILAGIFSTRVYRRRWFKKEVIAHKEAAGK